ncbi:hypothetical protein [Paenibacillus alvei]|uniref:Beta/gamma crystallin 'Greek key' domain-containing protein n=1 Tax=Paenibacillus alvei TaxID=44250 RepID=A0A383RHK0_PAEAL|nr:hypothetical protein [Paenibacillus alvei]SYX85829.1 conserved exported protein of unknown function [Paenibacillus alvei]
MKGVVKLISTLTTSLLLFVTLWSVPASAYGAGPVIGPTDPPVAYLCEDADYQGTCLGLYPGQSIFRLDEIGGFPPNLNFNDKASSIKIVDNRYSVTVYEHLAYNGRSTTYSSFSDRDMDDDYIGNDEASSVQVTGPFYYYQQYQPEALNGVYLYDNYGMSGERIKLNSSANTIPLNDKISSIRIVGPYDITIFEHADFTGRSLSFSGKSSDYGATYHQGTMIPDLVPYGFNDVTSSILITKRN